MSQGSAYVAGIVSAAAGPVACVAAISAAIAVVRGEWPAFALYAIVAIASGRLTWQLYARHVMGRDDTLSDLKSPHA